MRFFVVAAAIVALALGATTVPPPSDIQKQFDEFDANADGSIDMPEFRTLFLTADADSDGAVSAAEFVTEFSKLKYTADQALFIFFLNDANEDQSISDSEMEAGYKSRDVNKDGKVTFEEYKETEDQFVGYLKDVTEQGAKVSAMVAAADVDDDDKLTGAEMWSIASPADKDGNGVDKAEFETFWMAKTGYGKYMTDRLFSAFDGDKNGVFGGVAEKDAIYKAFDNDKDGTVSTAEFGNAMIFLYAQAARQSAPIAEDFSKLDGNSDGSIDKSEYRAVFKPADTDGSGTISGAEFVKYFAKDGFTADQALLTFFLTDSNEDTSISFAEIDASADYRDQNKDGVTTLDEFLVTQMEINSYLETASKSGDKITAMVKAADVDDDDELTGAEMWSIVSPADKDGNGVDQAEFETFWMANTGYSKYLTDKLFSYFDGDKNGVFGGDEEKKAIYAGFDYEKSGSVSIEEFKNSIIFLYAKATREMPGKAEVKDPIFSIETLFKEADANGDGHLSLSEIAFADEVSVTDFLNFYTLHGMNFHAALYLFYGSDKNNDNKYSRDEMEAAFKYLDVDDNKEVSLMEMASSFNVAFSELSVAKKTGERLDVMFDGGDADHDDELTRDEFSSVFGPADTDDNDSISEDEFKSFWMRNTKEPEDRTDVMFEELDENDDDKLDKAEEDKLFSGFDYNKDKMVSKSEFGNSMLFLFAEVVEALKEAKATKVVIG